ncbi:MAG: acyl-ACP thioesterase [Treponema sp.]|jgi:acyl-ACP thioesterase|nr:acyl-ACP thioesterase [Treponema sp.]
MVNIWQETLTVNFGAVDRSDRLTLASTFDFFQEVAICHAEDLGCGRDAMARLGQVWVLSRISVLLERRPKQGEAITVRSWPRGWERLFAVRDYDIRDASDAPIVRGRSSWIILDIERRRPLRPQALMGALPLNEGLDALPGGGGALEARDRLLSAGERRAAYSDIDYNGHVNNARYIQWIQDITEPEILERAERMRLDINYLSEIKPGEVTGLFKAPIIPGEAPAASGEKALAFEGRRQLLPEPAGPSPGEPGPAEAALFRAELRTWEKER